MEKEGDGGRREDDEKIKRAKRDTSKIEHSHSHMIVVNLSRRHVDALSYQNM